MKIAFFVSQFPALSETFVLNQITGLIERGHSIEIYATGKKEEEKLHPDVIKYNLLALTRYLEPLPSERTTRLIKFTKPFLSGLIKDLSLVLKSINPMLHGKLAITLIPFYLVKIFIGNKKKFDVIHCHFGPMGSKAVLLRSVGAISGKITTVFHGFDITRYIDKFGSQSYEKLFKYGDLFLPISERWKKRLIEIGCDEKKILVHRMGVDCKQFKYNPRKFSTDLPLKIISVARLVEKKGIRYAILAIAKIIIRYSNVEYKIIGDGVLRQELEELISSLNLSNQIKILGWKTQEEIQQIMSNANILLAPSVTSDQGDQEGIPVALMEAMSVGLPVISTIHSGIPELIEDSVSGLLARERDVDGLAERISYLLDNPEKWGSFEKNARDVVENNYDINKLNDRLVKLFESII